MAGNKRVAWILGAGFSVPLGGPLFRELISDEMLRRLIQWDEYTQAKWMAQCPHGDGWNGLQLNAGVSARIVAWLYEAGLGKEGTAKLWEDAEQFLERLEIAASGSLLVGARVVSSPQQFMTGYFGPNIFGLGAKMPGATQGLLTTPARAALMAYDQPT